MTGRYPEPPEDFLDQTDLVDAPYFFDRLEDELVAAAERQRLAHGARPTHRRRPLLVAAVALLVGGVAAIAALGLTADPAPASLSIETTTTGVVLTLDGGVVDPDQVVADLAEAGIDATVSEAIASPTFEGAIVGWLDISDDDIETADTDGDGIVDRLEIPDGFNSPIEILIGTTDPATTLEVPINCDTFLSRTVGEVRDTFAELYPRARWVNDLTPDGPATETPAAGIPATHQITTLAYDGINIIVVATPPTADPQLVCST